MSKPIYSNTGNSTPWLSVIVPMYNAQAYVEQTIRSILSQTFQDYELLLVDDGSTDSTEEICTRYAAQDRRIRYLKKQMVVPIRPGFMVPSALREPK